MVPALSCIFMLDRMHVYAPIILINVSCGKYGCQIVFNINAILDS